MAARHWKISQHLEIIDYYGRIVSLKLLLQRQLIKLSVHHCDYNSFNHAKCVYYTRVQTCRDWFPRLWPSSHQAAPCSCTLVLHVHLLFGLLLLHSSMEHCKTYGWCIFKADGISLDQSFITPIIRFWPPARDLVHVCRFPHRNLFLQLLVQFCQQTSSFACSETCRNTISKQLWLFILNKLTVWGC